MKPRNLKLGTVEQEAARCRRSFRGVKVGRWAVHLHHNAMLEQLTELPEERIRYILEEKPKEERALRLRLFRPVRPDEVAAACKTHDKAGASGWEAYKEAMTAAWKAYGVAGEVKAYEEATTAACKAYNEARASAREAIHENSCRVRGCPWDGHTIFPSSGE